MDNKVASGNSPQSKNCRPCDGCSLRKVKCDQKMPCLRCLTHKLPCTNNRITKKRGPKKIREKTRESITGKFTSKSAELTNHQNEKQNSIFSDPCKPRISFESILPCLQIYQTWFYEIWPVISIAQLKLNVLNNRNNEIADLTSDNISSYCLCCALSAAITTQMNFLSSNAGFRLPEEYMKNSAFVDECVRARDLHNYRSKPSVDSLLTSFFLHVYYTNLEPGSPAAILYLREAVSISEILGLHDIAMYENKSRAEVHRLRKMYYMLLVTERFASIDANLAPLLDASIPFPSLGDEEYPLLSGFSQIVKIFALPDKTFFKKNSNNPVTHYSFLEQKSKRISKKWILNLQNDLSMIEILEKTPDIQKLNIVLSQNWMKLLVWDMCKSNRLLMDQIDDTYECLSLDFPIKIARELLSATQNLPIFAFESNGPGVCSKLLEIADGLSASIDETNFDIGYDSLNSILCLISKLSKDVSLSVNMCTRLQSIATNKRILGVSNFSFGPTQQRIEYMIEDSVEKLPTDIDDSIDGDLTDMLESRISPDLLKETASEILLERKRPLGNSAKLSPLSQLAMSFSLYPEVSPNMPYGNLSSERTVPITRNLNEASYDYAFSSELEQNAYSSNYDILAKSYGFV